MLKTLRAKLLAFFLLTTFIPLLFIGYISYQSQNQELTKQIENSLLVHSSVLAVEIKNLLSERIADVELLAKNPVIVDPDATRAEIKQQFEDFLDVYEIYSDTIFVKSNGIVYTSMVEEVVGRNLSSRPWFQASQKGEVHISDIYYSPIIDQPVLLMSVPVRSETGKVVGVISLSFNLEILWENFGRFSDQKQMVEVNGYAFLMNKTGNIIAHPNYEKILTENYLETNKLLISDIYLKSNQREISYNHQVDTVLVYAQLEKMEGFDKDWFVGISVSKTALLKPLQKLLTNYLLIIGLVLLLTTIAIFKLSNYIVSPVEKLVAVTTDFAMGKSILPLLKDSYKEIDRLNNTFVAMTKNLREQERGHKKSTLIIETTDNGVIAINKKTEIVTLFNSTCEKIFNIKKEDVVDFSVSDVIKKSTNFREFITSSKLVNGFSEQITTKFELQCQYDQKTFDFFVSMSSLPSLENEAEHEELLIVFNDLTEKRQMERDLVSSEKLKVVGEMAAGLAHEIRNPLAIIRGFIQLFNESEKDAQQVHYDIIIKEIDRVNNIITDLLNIANPRLVEENKDTNIIDLLEDLLILQQSQLKYRGIILKKQWHHLPTIYIDSSKVQQVCINIIQNAIEAMEEEGGCLNVSTKHLVDEDMVSIYIKDTGVGIDPEIIGKLGTPFYTTKRTGTGLGLMTCYRIIKEMHGTLTVSSEKGKGSIFTITLPINKVEN